jgi:hypothetical protein
MVNRIMPQGRVQDYQTFRVSTPRDGAIVQACKDAGCQAWAHGWTSLVDESTSMGRAQAHYIRWQSGRDFKESRSDGGMTVFTFAPFQRCFAEHKTIPEAYTVEHGDWRGNPSGSVRVHANAADWVEQFAENQLKLSDQAQQGSY